MSNERNETESSRRKRDASVEFVIVYGECGYYRVSRRTAARIAAQLDKRLRPRWITFEDICNALVRVRTRDVQGLYDSSPAIRDRARRMARALEKEENDSKDWTDRS
ncbi:MAG: hypothetical protein U0163_19710 [Gemmatimonadaceae bacterium]